ncbi:TM0106 family RecB-like putative nuclease [Arthrobacter cheniae]|uniref:TM0106 family RecB-like putative nuclease n=1 Tax=Arthrobacter cheniae TaxID=1258888 RepID=A0A3A5LYK5_9MICC|nr:bifunctional RecB family nuclease/DEAD/DEAH box helicase [Arthrobacter cheniae]RJT77334.1 TM0106 family RecB-like putative nuclease [Arthrobacter cheniae]
MFLLDYTGSPAARPDLVFSATDLVTASECGYRLLRVLDEKLGRAPRASFAADEMLQRAAHLGDVHEHRVLNELIAQHGLWSPDNATGVYDVEPAASMERTTLEAKHEESVRALRSGASVVFQAAFFDGRFHGRSDFLVRQEDGAYAVWDTKLARHAKVGALLQLAAYGDQLQAAGIPASPEVTLVLGDRTRSTHSLTDLLPVFRERRTRFLDLVDDHRNQPDPVVWGDPAVPACGRCDYCAERVEATRDLLLVASMTGNRRARLHGEGITTIDQLAAMPRRPEDTTLTRLQDQARLQVGLGEVDGGVTYEDAEGTEHTLSYRVLPQNTLSPLPAPSPGDIFFDFEGDPLWQDPVDGSWGLEYLFGVVEEPVGDSGASGEPHFRPFWAHSRAEERTAFIRFLDYVADRRRHYPDLHIYHYAAYEKTALRRLSLVHVIGEDAVDTLLRDGVLVDLYDTVRHSLRISERSYSLKKLEPLYMGSTLRTGDVTDAGASVVAYAAYCEARDDGDDGAAAEILAGISDYNRYDCLSTLRLRDWLLALGSRPSASPSSVVLHSGTGSTHVGEAAPVELPAEEARLQAYLADLPPDVAAQPDQRAIALVAAAVGYHRRERKQFWWSHFDRLAAPASEWEQSRDVMAFRSVEVLLDWSKPNPRSNPVRTLEVTARLEAGADFRDGGSHVAIYDAPVPDGADTTDSGGTGRGGWFGVELTELSEDGNGLTTAVIREKLRRGAEERPALPVALAPDQPIMTTSLQASLIELAGQVGRVLPEVPAGPALDLLRRTPPRLDDGGSLPPVTAGGEGYAEAITAALHRLANSYLAVQGPPGTGKTHVGAEVIARLVDHGWKVGVVAQSHAVVDNLLCRAMEAGVPDSLVAKKPRDGEQNLPWTQRLDTDVARLVDAQGGCLIGGTAWTMTGRNVPAGSLDLLVIDEAGQFSLANTMAVARAARRLLLLGDPQQLPQVSQGTHPEPVDESALGWLSAGHATLPPEFGYFIADTWRMHPELCGAVSAFAYDGRLTTAPAARARRFDGADPGIECVLVDHVDNATSSRQEAVEVVEQVERHLGLPWTEESGAEERPLHQSDILVVAAYNAQVQLVRKELAAAGYGQVRVGTVDRFQGQQAVVVIVSMAASSAAEAPRGIGFLLNRNRINVAVSRGQWRAVIIRSPRLTHHMPSTPSALEELGAFIGLCGTRA